MAEQLHFAIGHKRLLGIRYSDRLRIVEPHDYGVNKGVERLLVYQLRDDTNASGRSTTGWRLLDIAKLQDCIVLNETFPGSRGQSHQKHYDWDPLYARVA